MRADLFHTFWVDRYVSKFYDRVTSYHYWDRSKHHEQAERAFRKEVYKLKPEFEHRMIRKGYKDSQSKSFGKYFDIERAFQGFPGPLTVRHNHEFRTRGWK